MRTDTIKLGICKKNVDTYMSGGIDLRTGFQEPPDNVIVAHLRRDPQRRSAVRSCRVRLRSMLQQNL